MMVEDGARANDIVELERSAAIAQALAEQGPFLELVGGMLFCMFCRFTDGLDIPFNHDPACLWRRASELYPNP